MRVDRTPKGQIISAFGGDDYDHPWKLRPFWNADLGMWCSRVVPGFVNARDVVIAMDVKGGTEDVAMTAQTADENQAEDAPTFEDALGPYLRMDGWDHPLLAASDGHAEMKGPLMDYFRSLGVRDPQEQTQTDETGATTTVVHAPAPANPGTKDLACADVVLVGDHTGVRTEVISSNPLLGQEVVNSVAVIPKFDRYPFRLNSVPRFAGNTVDPALLSALDGSDGEEATFESLLIARLWMVSPDNPEDSSPDETWQPLVQNFVFWNLSFASRADIQRFEYNPLTLQTGLVAGLADSIFNAQLDPINAANQLALQTIANKESYKSFFWS